MNWLLSRTWKHRWAALLAARIIETYERIYDRFHPPAWEVDATGSEVHVHPLGDLWDHDLDMDCGCGPKVIWGDDDQTYDRPLVTHHSLDGRELAEPSRVS